jgi:glutamate dehydrogenase
VIDIVTDDMPFLVDSVTMVLAARDLGIHAVVHPMLTSPGKPARSSPWGLGTRARRGSTSRSTARARRRRETSWRRPSDGP